MSKTRRFNKLKCSPELTLQQTKRLSRFTCYDSKRLKSLKREWNNYNPDDKITDKDDFQIWKQLKQKMSKQCKDERCWLDQPFMEDKCKFKTHENIFSPKMPDKWKSNIYTWLNSNDIIKLMKQYKRAYPNFMFIGPSAIDFDSKDVFGNYVYAELANLDINSIKSKKNKIGIILNLDTHDKPGSHWVCMFIDLAKKFIFYFDSNGDKPPVEVDRFVDRIKKQSVQVYGKEFKYSDNRNIEHQYLDGTCGIYALYVIIELLMGKKTPAYLKKHRITDKMMTKHRFIYFNEK